MAPLCPGAEAERFTAFTPSGTPSETAVTANVVETLFKGMVTAGGTIASPGRSLAKVTTSAFVGGVLRVTAAVVPLLSAMDVVASVSCSAGPSLSKTVSGLVTAELGIKPPLAAWAVAVTCAMRGPVTCASSPTLTAKVTDASPASNVSVCGNWSNAPLLTDRLTTSALVVTGFRSTVPRVAGDGPPSATAASVNDKARATFSSSVTVTRVEVALKFVAVAWICTSREPSRAPLFTGLQVKKTVKAPAGIVTVPGTVSESGRLLD